MIQCNESVFYRSRKSVLTSDPFFFQRFSPVNSAIASMVLWFFRKPNCSQLKKSFNLRKLYLLMWTTTLTILPNVGSGEIGLYFVNSSSDHFSNKGKTFATASCSRKTFVTNQYLNNFTSIGVIAWAVVFTLTRFCSVSSCWILIRQVLYNFGNLIFVCEIYPEAEVKNNLKQSRLNYYGSTRN